MGVYQSAVQSAIEWHKKLIQRRANGAQVGQEEIDEAARRIEAFVYIEKELTKVAPVDLSALNLE